MIEAEKRVREVLSVSIMWMSKVGADYRPLHKRVYVAVGLFVSVE